MSLAEADPALAVLASLASSPQAAPTLRATLAEALLAAGHAPQAADLAARCVADAPDLAVAWLVRAEVARRAARFADAAGFYARASALTPHRVSLLVHHATCLIELDRPAEAEALLRRAVALAPDCVPALANLASVLVRRGDLAAAELPARAALSHDPGLVSAHQNLSAILDQCDPAAARAHRDAAYRAQHLFTAPAADAALSILILAAADTANTPLRALFDRGRTTLHTWYVEYADPAQPPPRFDLIVNAISEPEWMPRLPPCVRAMLARNRTRLLNPPPAIARTARHALPARLAGIAPLCLPPPLRARTARARTRAATRIGYPLLLRPLGSHGGRGLTRIDGPAALAAVPDFPAILTRFIDFRSPDSYWRKYRVIFVDRVPYPLHLAISPHWLVHHCTAGMEHDPARMTEEAAFLADWRATLGPAATVIAAIGARLDLDFAGVDFALLADGTPLIFEANAAMLVQPEPADGPFAYRNQAVSAIQQAFRAMLHARARSAC